MSEHTPGPWKIEQHSHAEIYSGSILVADVLTGGDSADGCGRANASLISAAPDLLEACREALSMYEVQLQLDAENDPTCQKLRAAIAKASGNKKGSK